MSLPSKSGLISLGHEIWSPAKGHGVPFRSYTSDAGSGDTVADAAKGYHIRPLVPVIMHSVLICIYGTSLAASTYQGLIGEYNLSTNQLVTTNFTDSYAFPGSMGAASELVCELDFVSPLFLKANVDYIMAALITSGTDATAVKIMYGGFLPFEFPAVSAGRALLAKMAPATSDTWTWTASGNPASIGGVGYYFPWGL